MDLEKCCFVAPQLVATKKRFPFEVESLRVLPMLTILKDAERSPKIFYWFGAIALEQIESWMKSNSIIVPSDLVEFWRQTGGGDLFDGETILRPTRIPSIEPYFIDGDDVDSVTQFQIQNGMPDSYLPFQIGSCFSAVRLPDQVFVTLDDASHETAVFATFEEWYLRTLRADFGAHYGLPNEVTKS